jgi:integrase
VSRAKSPRTRKPSAQQALDLRDPGQPTLGMVVTHFTRAYLEGELYSLSTRRGYKSTFRLALKHFGKDATLTKGQAREWLRPDFDSGKRLARALNSHRDKLHAAYVKYRDDVLGITLNPWSFPRFPEGARHLRTDFQDMEATWPKLLAAMPDARAKLFLMIAARLGWRLGELLGLEEGHLMRTTAGDWVVRKEQQRKLWEDVPRGLKHGGLVGTFKLHPEMVKLVLATRRALEAKEPLLGCQRGALVGGRPGKDGSVRSYVFPYREEHVQELMTRLRAAAPEEFPAHQAWHRLRRAFAKHVAQTLGMEEANRLLGHAHYTSTQLYCRQVVGVSATGADIDKLYESQEKVLCASSHEAHNIFEAVEE